jgi:hypothetical protein
MSAVEDDRYVESEAARVEWWRAEALARAGYPAAAVLELAPRADVDLHTAIALIKRGCPAALALQILR